MSDEHLSFDELAELAEGLLARRRARAAEEHLAACPACQERADALRDTTTALRELGPVSMPTDVAARLDRVIANAASAPAGETVVPDLGAVRRRRLAPPSWSYAAAAAIAIVAAVAIVVATTGHHNGSPSNSYAAVERTPLVATSAPQSLVQQESGQIYTPGSLTTLVPGLVTGGLAGAPMAGALLPAQAAHEPNQASKSAGSGATSGDGTTSGPLGSAPVPAASPTVHAQQNLSATVVPKRLRRYADSRTALLACAAFITNTTDAAPLAVDFARWTNPATHARRVPALILVFADPQESSQLEVYVVGASCNDSALLDYQVIPKS